MSPAPVLRAPGGFATAIEAHRRHQTGAPQFAAIRRTDLGAWS